MKVTTEEAASLIREWHEQKTVLVFGVSSLQGQAGQFSVAVRDCRIEASGEDVIVVNGSEPPVCTATASLVGATFVYSEGRELNRLLLKDDPDGQLIFSHEAKLLTLYWECLDRTIVLQEQELQGEGVQS